MRSLSAKPAIVFPRSRHSERRKDNKYSALDHRGKLRTRTRTDRRYIDGHAPTGLLIDYRIISTIKSARIIADRKIGSTIADR